MNYGMIIQLSGRKISFLYNKADKNGLFPFDGNRPVLPLAILKENDELVIGDAALRARQTGSRDAYVDILKDIKRQGTFSLKGQEHSYGDLLLLAVEKHLSDFMAQAYLLQGTTYEAVKSELPLGFIFNDCISAADKDMVKNLFVSHGYQNIADIDVNTYLFQQFGRPNVLVISGDGQDLSLKLYDRESKEIKAQQILPGAGVDPRVQAVAELFYNNLSTAGIGKDKALPVLETEAAIVLEKNPSEYEGRVNIDGLSCEFFVTRREIEAAVTAIVGSAENLGIAEFVRSQDVDLSDCTLFIQRSLADNSYFCKTLKNSFPDANLVDEQREKEVMKSIDLHMRENKFAMQALDSESEESASPSVAVGSDKPGQLDKLPKKNVKGTPYDTYIKFDILVPKGARYVELWRRDGGAPKDAEELIERVLPTLDDDEEEFVITTYTDSGLKELTPYMYNFVAVYFDEFGNELRTKDLELQYRTVPRVASNERPIELVVTNDEETSVTLKWNTMKRAQLKFFVSDEPYTIQSGDIIANEGDIAGTLIDVEVEQQNYKVDKDFHGERFYLPVTVRNGQLMAGKTVRIQSAPQPLNVKATYVDSDDAVRVEWDWKNIRDVQVVWQYPQENRVPVEVHRASQEGMLDVAQSPKQSKVIVEVRSVFTSKVDGSQVFSAPVKRTVEIPVANVELSFVKAVSRGKYSYTLSSQGGLRVPGDLRLLVKEGSDDFDTVDKRIDIKREQWQQGKASKQFDFAPRDKYNDVFFRLVLADEALSRRINIVAQDRMAPGEERPANKPPKVDKPKPTRQDEDSVPTFTDRPKSNTPHDGGSRSGNNGGGNVGGTGKSNTLRNVIIFAIVAVIGYFAWSKCGGSNDEPTVISVEKHDSVQTPVETPVETPKSKTGRGSKKQKTEQQVEEPAQSQKTDEGDKNKVSIGGGVSIEVPGKTQTSSEPAAQSQPKATAPTTITVNFLQSTSLIAHIFVDGNEVGAGSWSGVLEGPHSVNVKLQKPGKKKMTEIKQTWSIQCPARLTIPIDPGPFE